MSGAEVCGGELHRCACTVDVARESGCRRIDFGCAVPYAPVMDVGVDPFLQVHRRRDRRRLRCLSHS